MSNIPEGRRLLLELADRTDTITASEIRHIVEQYLVRDVQVKRAPIQSEPVTAELRDRVINMAAKHPDMAMSKIGELCGVNQGRVSEILTGKR